MHPTSAEPCRPSVRPSQEEAKNRAPSYTTQRPLTAAVSTAAKHAAITPHTSPPRRQLPTSRPRKPPLLPGPSAPPDNPQASTQKIGRLPPAHSTGPLPRTIEPTPLLLSSRTPLLCHFPHYPLTLPPPAKTFPLFLSLLSHALRTVRPPQGFAPPRQYTRRALDRPGPFWNAPLYLDEGKVRTENERNPAPSAN
jgi:hypothetical protein